MATSPTLAIVSTRLTTVVRTVANGVSAAVMLEALILFSELTLFFSGASPTHLDSFKVR